MLIQSTYQQKIWLVIESYLEGKVFSLSADGLMDFNPTETDVEVDELFDQCDGRTAITFTFTL